jgi:hypothetical protein
VNVFIASHLIIKAVNGTGFASRGRAVGGLPVGPVTTDPFGAHGIRMYPDQDPVVLEETRRYFEKLAERFSNDLPKA